MTKMTREFAIVFLLTQGWNMAGAEAIVDAAIEDGTFRDDMSESELAKLSDEYTSR